jgi:tryptophan aminotransferase
VLELAHKYNLLVLEDDAYHYLFYGTDKVTTRPASYFELEARTGKVGHVVRFDTMSKVFPFTFSPLLCPGRLD